MCKNFVLGKRRGGVSEDYYVRHIEIGRIYCDDIEYIDFGVKGLTFYMVTPLNVIIYISYKEHVK